jgi:integrase
MVDAQAPRERAWAALGSKNGKFLPCCRLELARLNLHMHDLRRETGSRLPERGAGLHTVQQFLDHANISTSSQYLKPSKLALHATIQRIDEQRRRCAEAAKWEEELAEMRKSLQDGTQKGHKLVKSSGQRVGKNGLTASKSNDLGA